MLVQNFSYTRMCLPKNNDSILESYNYVYVILVPKFLNPIFLAIETQCKEKKMQALGNLFICSYDQLDTLIHR